jgi:glycosyl transferase family 4
MSGRVLIVTNTYAPAMIADMHRTRHLAWELPSRGWEVEVLVPDDSYQLPVTLEADSAAFFAPGTPVHRVAQRCAPVHRALGLGSIGWRALVPMYRAGLRLLRARRFDLVYISTTQFPLFLLGPAWKRRLGVRYVLDVHDPCYKPPKPGAPRPRGPKHRASAGLARAIESVAMRSADGLVSVSPDYLAALTRRYRADAPRWLDAARNAVIPFAVDMRDLAEAGAGRREASSAGPACIAYVGAGAPVMARAFDLFCRALAAVRASHPELAGAIRIEIAGTRYQWREGEPRLLQDIARRHGVGDLVHEDPRRVSYRTAVAVSLEAAGLLVLGVDDRGYMPSKLFAYAATGRPLLAALRREGPAWRWIAAARATTHGLWFEGDAEMPLAQAAAEVEAFLREVAARATFDRAAALAACTSPAMAERHAALFEACVA